MDLENEIITLRSRQRVDRIVRWIGADVKRFGQLMKLFLTDDQEISRRAAWVVGHCCEQRSQLAKPWIHRMTEKMQEPDAHCAIQRNVMHILQHVEIPKPLLGTVTILCFNILSDVKAPIATRALAITVLANIAKDKPALLKELRVLVQQALPYSTPAFRARAKKIFKDLKVQEEGEVALSRKEEDKLLRDWLMRKE